MEAIGALVVGLAAGWLARAGIDSKRELAVRCLTAAYAMRDNARRFVAVERENVEDLVAEARARYEARTRRNAHDTADAAHAAADTSASQAA